MGLVLSRDESKESWSGGNAFMGCARSQIHYPPVKILIADGKGTIFACNYYTYFFADDSTIEDGNRYVRDEQVNMKSLVKVKQTEHESGTEDIEDLADLIVDLLKTPGCSYMSYDGYEEKVLPREYWNFILFKIPKKPQMRFVHSFSFYKKII